MRLQTPALQVDLHPVLAGKRGQSSQIVRARRLHDAKNQGRALIAGREFDLRHLFTNAERLHQGGELRRQIGEPPEQDLAAADIGQVGTLPFAKPREHAAFLMDVFDAQPGAPPIGPVRPPQGREHAFRPHPPDTLEVVEQLALLGGELCGGRQMLQ